MRVFWKGLMSLAIAGLLLSPVSAQKKPAPAMPPPQPPPAAAQAAQAPNQRVVVVEPVRIFDPSFDYPYPYTYAPEYMATTFGYVKIKTELKDASIYIDGGFADKTDKAKKFALRPGTHNIELRDSDGRTLLQQRVAVTVGKTTELKVG